MHFSEVRERYKMYRADAAFSCHVCMGVELPYAEEVTWMLPGHRSDQLAAIESSW